MKRFLKPYINKGLTAFICILLLTVSCITPRHTVEINDYVLLPNGKEVTGKEKGLTAFVFENNPRKIPFVQFAADKYQLGYYRDVSFWVTYQDTRFKVFVYETDEINKYFDMSEFMVTNVEAEATIVGSKAPFIALSVINEYNEDCLLDTSLYQGIAINYLKSLKYEYLR